MGGKSPVAASDEQRVALTALAGSRDRGEADRARAVLLTLSGWSSPQIAEAFGVREDTVRLWRSVFGRGGVDALKASIAPGLPPVWADGAQIRQVIHNLVQNAQDSLDHTRSAGANAAIEVRTELAGDRVRLAVSDNGGGFPEELMARIFEPYVTTKPRGTGLGLAIVKKIVDEHHGSVAIENRPSRNQRRKPFPTTTPNPNNQSTRTHILS